MEMKISINFNFAIFLDFSEKLWKYWRDIAYLVRKSVKYSFNTPKTCQYTPKIRFLHVVRIRSLFFKCANVNEPQFFGQNQKSAELRKNDSKTTQYDSKSTPIDRLKIEKTTQKRLNTTQKRLQ